jgi:hypothetical protein
MVGKKHEIKSGEDKLEDEGIYTMYYHMNHTQQTFLIVMTQW